MADVQDLPETQRTALLLREIDALSYEQIAEAMETTIPSVKSLLVRARVSLAEAAEARLLTCEEVREELGEVAEGLRRTSAAGAPPPARLRALPGLPQAAAPDQQGARRHLPGRPAAAAQEALLAAAARGAAAGGSAGAGGAAAARRGRGARALPAGRRRRRLQGRRGPRGRRDRHRRRRRGPACARTAAGTTGRRPPQVAQAAPPIAAATAPIAEPRLRELPRRSPRASPCPAPVEEREKPAEKPRREGRRERRRPRRPPRRRRHTVPTATPAARGDPDARPDAGAGRRAAPGGRHPADPGGRRAYEGDTVLLAVRAGARPRRQRPSTPSRSPRRRSRRPSPRRPRTSAARQWIRLPSGTSASGASRITRPASSLAPRHSTSERPARSVAAGS